MIRTDPGLVLPYPPSVNSTYRWGQRRYYKVPAAKEWMMTAQLLARTYWRRHSLRYVMTGPVVVWGELVVPRVSADMDNCEKLLFDSLQGIAYVNDRQIRRQFLDCRERRREKRKYVEDAHVRIWVGSWEEAKTWIDALLPLG
jgi:Holliday junction resolvase RusA-like endonuclease